MTCLSPPDLLQKLKGKGTRSADVSKAMSEQLNIMSVHHILSTMKRPISFFFYKCAFFSFTLVKDKLLVDMEAEISTTSLRISLLCPVSAI